MSSVWVCVFICQLWEVFLLGHSIPFFGQQFLISLATSPLAPVLLLGEKSRKFLDFLPALLVRCVFSTFFSSSLVSRHLLFGRMGNPLLPSPSLLGCLVKFDISEIDFDLKPIRCCCSVQFNCLFMAGGRWWECLSTTRLVTEIKFIFCLGCVCRLQLVGGLLAWS